MEWDGGGSWVVGSGGRCGGESAMRGLFEEESEGRAGENRPTNIAPIPARSALRFLFKQAAHRTFAPPDRPDSKPVLSPDFEPNYPLKSLIST